MLNPNASSTPLTAVFPWSLDDPTSVLVSDSVQSDGRFVLHSWAALVLKSNRLLWLAGGPWTPALIASALQKTGCDAAANYLRAPASSSSSPLCIRSIPAELAETLLQSDCDAPPEAAPFDAEAFMKKLYLDVKAWVVKEEQPSWVFLDDVSALAAFVGSRLTYAFILSLQSLATRHPFGLVVRNSQDLDQMLTLQPKPTAWIGAGGDNDDDNNNNNTPWERSLVELVDWVVDVVPLMSGYTREAHGRLIFCSNREGHRMTTYNYCLTDNKALAIRVQGSS
jgi:hypothetical protein